MEVRLTRSLALPLTGKGLDRIISLDEAGRATGFLLEGHDIDHPDGWPLFGYWSMAFCESSDCEPDKREHFPFGTLLASGSVDDEENPTTLYLPKGDYTLHVIADRSPVRVDLTLPGLEGKASFRPRTPEAPGVITPTETQFTDPMRLIYSNGDDVTFGGTAAFAITAVRIRSDATVSQAVGHCLYQQQPPPRPAGFAPGCPAGTNFLVGNLVVSPFPTEFAYIGYFLFPSSQIRGIGTWYAAASVVTQGDAIAFGIDLGPPSSGASSVRLDERLRDSFLRRSIKREL